MDYLPINVLLKNRPVLVVGGGSVAARKAALLLKSGGLVTVVAPEILREMQSFYQQGFIVWEKAVFDTALHPVQKYALVIAATDDSSVNQAVYTAAHLHNIPVNIADQTELCDFILPAIVERGSITVAISTGGRSPVLARVLKNRLETWLPQSIGRLATFLEEKRNLIKACFQEGQRRQFWQKLLFGPLTDAAWQDNYQKVQDLFQKSLEKGAFEEKKGTVALIGAGPGDPELLTFKALKFLEQADVIVHDRLVSPAIIDLGRREAERIYVGKCKGAHSLPQEKINALLINLAAQGLQVARLKGGDPFVFGRGGEEATALANAKIPFQIIPGITAALGCSAAAWMPLTHRDYAHSCRLITAHRQNGALQLPWQDFVKSKETLVFYMGGDNVAEICEQLIQHGLAATTPAAIIENGTLPEQKISEGNLQTLPQQVRFRSDDRPALLIIGAVVRLREAWQQALQVEAALSRHLHATRARPMRDIFST